MSNTSIEWTDVVWNPVRGCTKVSEGCRNCYAETFAERWRGVPGHPYKQGFDLRLVPEKLAEPLSWKKPRRVFVNSMSDLFQDGVPDEYIDQVFAVMAQTPQHTYQVLTKRANRMKKYAAEMHNLSGRQRTRRLVASMYRGHPAEYLLAGEEGPSCGELDWPLPNVWLGVSVENQKAANERIPNLLATPAAVRFISAEPLLEEVDVSGWLGTLVDNGEGGYFIAANSPSDIHWVIVGGESGPRARQCYVGWIRDIVAQCKGANVPVFVKQLGALPMEYDPPTGAPDDGGDVRPYNPHGTYTTKGTPFGTYDRKGGDALEWPEDLRVRQFPDREGR